MFKVDIRNRKNDRSDYCTQKVIEVITVKVTGQ